MSEPRPGEFAPENTPYIEDVPGAGDDDDPNRWGTVPHTQPWRSPYEERES
jgi:hypothetical protein